MKRVEFEVAINNVRRAVSSTHLRDFYHTLRSGKDGRGSPSSDVMSDYASFMNKAQRFSADENKVLEIFELNAIKDASFWANFIEINKEKDGTRSIVNFLQAMDIFELSAERFLPLLRRSVEPPLIEGLQQDGSSIAIDLGKINFTIRELKGSPLSVKSLIVVLNEITALYESIVELYRLDYVDLIIGVIDSGSDKSIDIIGIAGAINKLSGFLLEGWDRIRFSKEQKLDNSLKSIAEGMEVIKKVSQSVQKNDITEEQGEKIKRNILRSIDSLFIHGVYTEEMEMVNPPKPSEIPFERKLMIGYQASEQRLTSVRTADTTTRMAARPRKSRTSTKSGKVRKPRSRETQPQDK